MCRTESFADDLRTGQGVVGGRAASSLRSAKTSPYKAGGFVTSPDGGILVLRKSDWRKRRFNGGVHVSTGWWLGHGAERDVVWW